jgi:hypothetical protein
LRRNSLIKAYFEADDENHQITDFLEVSGLRFYYCAQHGIFTYFRLSRWVIIYTDSVLGLLHRGDMGHAADVSEINAAS